MYKRILLKLSGEQLQGDGDSGFDQSRAKWIADEIKKVNNDTQVVVMIGGGNYVRGAELAGEDIARVTADSIGMLATVMNALALSDVFNSHGLATRALSNIKADQIIDQFTSRRALHHLEKGRVVIIAGGTGRPYMTTDTAAACLALELGCDAILKATKVDGVYDSDPTKNPEARKFDRLTLQQAIEQPEIKVMDKAALALAYEHSKSIIVFELLKTDNIKLATAGESVGTLVTNTEE